MKFHDRLTILHEQMLDDELSPIGQNLAELREGPGQEIRFRLVVTGQRMRAFDDPVDFVVYMLEKARAIAVLEPLENLSDVVFGDHQILLCIREQLLARRRTDRPAPKLGTEPTLVIAGISVLTLRSEPPYRPDDSSLQEVQPVLVHGVSGGAGMGQFSVWTAAQRLQCRVNNFRPLSYNPSTTRYRNEFLPSQLGASRNSRSSLTPGILRRGGSE